MSNVSGLAVGGCMLITLGKACSNTPAPAEWVIDVLSFFLQLMFLFVSLAEGYTYSARLALLPFCPIIPVVAARTWITAGQFLDSRLKR